ncbi:MAG: helix-turn-helix domain-containing protein [Candidatus Peregrinibacteria bacterium]
MLRPTFDRGRILKLLEQSLSGDWPKEIAERLRWLLHYADHGCVLSTCRHFSIARSTLYRWMRRFNPDDLTSLSDAPTHRFPPASTNRTTTVDLVERHATAFDEHVDQIPTVDGEQVSEGQPQYSTPARALNRTSILTTLERALNDDYPAEVIERLQWLLYFTDHPSVQETCRHFGIARKTFYRWMRRFVAEDLSSLANAPTTVRYAFIQPSRQPQTQKGVLHPAHTTSAYSSGDSTVRAPAHTISFTSISIETSPGASPASTSPEASSPHSCVYCRSAKALRLSLSRIGFPLFLLVLLLNAIAILFFSMPVKAGAASSWNPTLLVNTESFETIDTGDGTTSIEMRFGDTLNRRLYFDVTAQRFTFTAPLTVAGSITATGSLSIKGVMSGTTLRVDKNADIWGNLSASGTTNFKSAVTFGSTIKLNGVTYAFPTTDGTASGKVLKTNAAGQLSWSDGGVAQGVADSRYIKKSGDTMTGALTINLTSGFIGLNVMQMLSGSILHAEKALTSSGTIMSIGNITTRGTASGKNLTFMGASNSYILGNLGIGTTAPETNLEVVGTISGSTIKVQGNLSVSGSIMTELNTGGGVVYSNSGTLATTAKGASGQLLIAQGTTAPLWRSPATSMVWYLDGSMAVGGNQGAAVTMPYGFTPSSVNLRATGAPTGASLIVDIKKDGMTIFGTKPQIYNNYFTGGTGAVLSITDLSIGSIITVDVTQIGSTFAGSGVTIQLNGTRKY